MKKKLTALGVAAVMASSLSACGTLQNADKVKLEAEKRINKVEKLNENVEVKTPTQYGNVVFHEERSWLPSEEVDVRQGVNWDKAKSHVSLKGSYDFSTLASEITKQTGVVVKVAPDAESLVKGKVKLNYTGTLDGLLNQLASKYNANWKRIGTKDMVSFSTLESKTFVISGLPGSMSQTDTISGGTNNSTYQVDATSIWDSIEDTVKGMLSEKGHMSVSQATGMLTVVDTPEVIDKVKQYIKKVNKDLSSTVLVEVEVYSVDINDGDEFGIDWRAIYQTMARNAATGVGFSGGLTSTASNLVMNDGQIALGVIGNTEWNGSQILFKSLGEKGKVHKVSTRRILTLNNMAAPFKAGGQVAYVKESTTSISNGVSTTSVKQGVVDTGYYLNVVPHIIDMEKGELLLQVSMTAKDLVGMDTVSFNGGVIQTPKTKDKNIVQRVRLTSGETLMVAAYDDADIVSKMSGVADADHVGLGGSAVGNKSKRYIIMLIKPVVEKRKI